MTATEEITIRVDPATAKAYREATPELRRKVELLVHYRVTDILCGPRRGLSAAMDAAAAEAAANGLTDELLAEILQDTHDDRRA